MELQSDSTPRREKSSTLFYHNLDQDCDARKEIDEDLGISGLEADHARCASYLSVAKEHTGDFLLVLPKSKAMTLNTLEFITAVRYRLGCDIPNMPRKCNCARRPPLDKKGVHLTSCA